MNAASCYIGPHYNGIRLYMGLHFRFRDFPYMKSGVAVQIIPLCVTFAKQDKLKANYKNQSDTSK